MDFMSATATDREILRCSLFKGDVVITKDSETDDDIGVPAYISEDIDDLVCGYHLVILRPKPEKIDGAYLFYSLNSREAEHQFHARANGVTRFGLRKADIGTVTVRLPSLPEQRRIAHILGTLDDKIELNRRMNKTLEENGSGDLQGLVRGFRSGACEDGGSGSVSAGGDLGGCFLIGLWIRSWGRFRRVGRL